MSEQKTPSQAACNRFADPLKEVGEEGEHEEYTPDKDGSCRLYACRDNTSVKNWISTEGRHRGQIVLRTLLAETDLMPEMSVIKLCEIPDHDPV